ncbi:MAG: VWA domain-containing protein [Anaerolineales bacterium]|nr:MAG: VWA domain-containing protein [Anaerolineales bacterium]
MGVRKESTMIHRLVLALFAASTLLGLCPHIASADGMILPDLASANYMVVRYHDVKVDINDTFAVTRVEQEFYNPHDYAVTGQYVFPVPPGAAVTGFQATFDGRQASVIRQNGADSNIMLYDLVARRHDPSLLQYADWETLTFDINLPARSSRKMTLSYQEILPPSGGMLHYRYVLSTERYASLPLERASITLNIANSRGIGSVYSSSHNVTTSYPVQGHAKVTWEAFDTQPLNDFHLFITPAEGGFGGGFLTGSQNDTGHFIFMFAPERTDRRLETLPKDIVFAIDRSGSMAGEKIQQAQDALHFILDQLNANDRFSIVGFDDVFSTVADTLLPVNHANLTAAHAFVSRLYDRNGTDIEGALQVALGIMKDSESRVGASRMIVFLTDGLPTEGVTDPQRIIELVTHANRSGEARLHVFGVGYDVNTHLLDQLASNNGGSVTYVQPGENLEAVMSGFYERIAYPVLTDVTVEFDGITVSDLYPQQLPDLFESSTLLLTGRYQGDEQGTATITIHGNANGERHTYTYTVKLGDLENSAFVPGLWATRRIGHLLDIIRLEGESASLVEEVRAQGMRYGLITPYTTFIITAQAEGAASAENMALYGNTSELNRASGQTTIQARVQNQSYQQATQVDLARGANVLNNNGQTMVQMINQTIDLNLLRDYQSMDQAVTDTWLKTNFKVDRQVIFGSDTYFTLAADPLARAFLQSGNNVLFMFKGEIIEIRDDDQPFASQADDTSIESPGPAPAYPVYESGSTFRTMDMIKIRLSRFFSSVLRFFMD